MKTAAQSWAVRNVSTQNFKYVISNIWSRAGYPEIYEQMG